MNIYALTWDNVEPVYSFCMFKSFYKYVVCFSVALIDLHVHNVHKN